MTLYIPPHFREDDRETLLALVEANAFGTLVTGGGEGLVVSHIPFMVERDGDAIRLKGHVARANPHAQRFAGGGESVAIFQGPHAYVSPGWYSQHPSVPTWNYAVVHAHGPLRTLDEAELHELLMALSHAYEKDRPRPWKMSELPADYVSTMLRAIVGFEMAVQRVDGKFKLSQNRPADAPRVVAALESEAPEVAALMAAHPPKTQG